MGKLNGQRSKEYEEFCEMIESVGFWNLNETAYSEKSGIPRQTIQRWKEKWLKEDWKFDINQIKRILDSTGQTALKRLNRLAHSTDNELSRKASRDILRGMRDYIEVCKGTGLIESLPDEQAQVIIQATDKDLYNLLTPEQRKKLLEIKKE